MWQLIWRGIKDYKVSLIIYMVASGIFCWMYVAIFPSMAAQSEKMMEAFKNYPQDLFKAFDIDLSTMTFNKVESFISMENFSIIWPILLVAICVAIGSSAIAGEIEKGTMAILLSQPISRTRLFLAKYLSGAIILLAFVVFSVYVTIPLSVLHGVSYQISHYLPMAVVGLMYGLALYSLAMMLSAIFSERGKVIFIEVGLIVLMYALNILASLKENLSGLKYLSFFNYYDQRAALVEGRLVWEGLAVFAAVTVVCTLVGVWVFQRRDIAV